MTGVTMFWTAGTAAVGLFLMVATCVDEDVKPLNATVILAVWPALLVVFAVAGALDVINMLTERQ